MDSTPVDIKEDDFDDRFARKERKAKKMLLIIGIISIIMMFSGLTSAYIVTQGGAKFWVKITMPNAFWISTVLMLLSSLTVHLATKWIKKGKKTLTNYALVITLLLGCGFIYSQFQGWNYLADKNLTLTGNYLKALNGEYGKDFYITYRENDQVERPVMVDKGTDGHYYDSTDRSKPIDDELRSFRNPSATYMNMLTGLHALHVIGGILFLIYVVVLGLSDRLSPARTLPVTQAATYWHFVDLLWVYLLLFLYYIH